MPGRFNGWHHETLDGSPANCGSAAVPAARFIFSQCLIQIVVPMETKNCDGYTPLGRRASDHCFFRGETC